MEKCLDRQRMQQRCVSCSCVNVGGDQAVALSLGFGHSHDDSTNEITKTKISTTSVRSVCTIWKATELGLLPLFWSFSGL